MDNKKDRFHFTVSQLIDVLNSFPQDLPVLTSGYEDGFENFYYPKILELKHEPENLNFSGEFQISETYGENRFKAVVISRVFRND